MQLPSHRACKQNCANKDSDGAPLIARELLFSPFEKSNVSTPARVGTWISDEEQNSVSKSTHRPEHRKINLTRPRAFTIQALVLGSPEVIFHYFGHIWYSFKKATTKGHVNYLMNSSSITSTINQQSKHLSAMEFVDAGVMKNTTP